MGGEQVMGMYDASSRICSHGYQEPHCPRFGCAHHGNVSAQQQLPEIWQARQAISPLGGAIPGLAQAGVRPCEHCYCMTPTVQYGGGPHKQCCNCGNRQKTSA